ncbi:MAG: hypothetical protein H7281_08990 [Bacteriovorax sp.]|nr:hypothetical protein [Bacteriovorax sp.]
MAKLELNLKDVKGFILSPGNIFWQQNSGAHVLLSAKSDFLNYLLIEKLSKSNYILLIENQIDLQLQHDFVFYFKSHQLEILIKEKLQWRLKLMGLFSLELARDEVSQFEIDQLMWKVFSRVEHEEAKKFLDKDIDLFKRGMSIAASYTICAFLLGYYSDAFLTKIFNETFLNLMDLNISVPIQTLKIQLEKIRNLEHLTAEDNHMLEDIYQLGNNKNVILAERYDGSGYRQINKSEMNDLEIVLVALNEHYSFEDSSHKSIFFEIKKSQFKCDEKILNVMRKCVETKKNIVPIGKGA